MAINWKLNGRLRVETSKRNREQKWMWTIIGTNDRDRFIHTFPPKWEKIAFLPILLNFSLARRLVPPFVAAVSLFFWDNPLKRIIKKKTTKHVNLQKIFFYVDLKYNNAHHSSIDLVSLSLSAYSCLFRFLLHKFDFVAHSSDYFFVKFLLHHQLEAWNWRFHAGLTEWKGISSVERSFPRFNWS